MKTGFRDGERRREARQQRKEGRNQRASRMKTQQRK